MTFPEALGWFCWALAPVTVFFYGRSLVQGGVCGVVNALLFIAWGVAAGIPGAALSNLIFVVLHVRNLRRGLR